MNRTHVTIAALLGLLAGFGIAKGVCYWKDKKAKEDKQKKDAEIIKKTDDAKVTNTPKQ